MQLIEWGDDSLEYSMEIARRLSLAAGGFVD